MKIKGRISKIGLAAIGLAISFTAGQLFAGTQPKFSIIATHRAPNQIANDGIATASYLVTNNTRLRRSLTMHPIPGINQLNNAWPTSCSKIFTLDPQQSCTLDFEIIGSQLHSPVRGGPVVCKADGDSTPDPLLCSQASEADIFNIVVGSASGGD